MISTKLKLGAVIAFLVLIYLSSRRLKPAAEAKPDPAGTQIMGNDAIAAGKEGYQPASQILRRRVKAADPLPLPIEFLPRADWKAAGNESPEAAIKTFFWAAAQTGYEQLLYQFTARISNQETIRDLLKDLKLNISAAEVTSLTCIPVNEGDKKFMQVEIAKQDGSSVINISPERSFCAVTSDTKVITTSQGYEVRAWEPEDTDEFKARVVITTANGNQSEIFVSLRKTARGWRVHNSQFGGFTFTGR